MTDKTVLCIADTGSGKSSSLRYLPLESTVYVNVDAKPLPFKHNRLYKNVELQSTEQLLNGMANAEEDPAVEYVVIDTITMLGDMFFAEHIENSANTMGGWGAYKSYLLKVINIAKRSKKTYIFLAHAQDVYDEKEMITKTFAKIQGSLKGGGLESHFTYVLYTIVRAAPDGMPEFLYLANKAKGYVGVSAKTPFGMFENPWFPNDIRTFLDAVDAFHTGD